MLSSKSKKVTVRFVRFYGDIKEDIEESQANNFSFTEKLIIEIINSSYAKILNQLLNIFKNIKSLELNASN